MTSVHIVNGMEAARAEYPAICTDRGHGFSSTFLEDDDPLLLLDFALVVSLDRCWRRRRRETIWGGAVGAEDKRRMCSNIVRRNLGETAVSPNNIRGIVGRRLMMDDFSARSSDSFSLRKLVSF